MRLPTTHSYTFRLNGEATEPIETQSKKKGKKGGRSLRDRKRVNENHRHITCKGGVARICRRKLENPK